MIFKSILPLIPRITTNEFLLILLYKGHAIKKTCEDIVTKKYDILSWNGPSTIRIFMLKTDTLHVTF
jgi:hypothetical protein